MKVKVGSRSFEKSDSEEMLSEEEINQRVNKWKPSHILNLPEENGLSGEEFEEAFENQLKNRNCAGLAQLCRCNLSPSVVRLFKRLAIINGYTN